MIRIESLKYWVMYTYVTIKKRIILFRKQKYLMGVVEISYSSSFRGMWLEYLAVLAITSTRKTTTLRRRSMGSYCNNRHDAVVKLLLAATDINPDLKDRYDQTLLLWAVENKHEAVIKPQLAIVNFDFLEKNKDGQMPLSSVAEKGHEGVVKLLLENGADLEVKNVFGRTLLSLVAENGHEGVWPSCCSRQRALM
jgi:hypothetical protein